MSDMKDRETIIAKARAKYIDTGVTNNITEALAAYLDNDAGPDEQIPLFVTSQGIRDLELALAKIRPTCDECGGPLQLKIDTVDPTGKQFETAWICVKCKLEAYSSLTAESWLKELQDAARQQDLQVDDKPVVEVLSAVR